MMIAIAIGFGQIVSPQPNRNAQSAPSDWARPRIIAISVALTIFSAWLVLRAAENRHRFAIESHVERINVMQGVDCYRAFGPVQRDFFDSPRWVTESSAVIWWGPVPVYKIPTFRVYAVWPEDFDDEHLFDVTQIDCIRELNLSRARISDAGLAHLKSLNNLHSLDVTGTRVTQAALDDLRRALPNLVDVEF